jgi:hypothetical protein
LVGLHADCFNTNINNNSLRVRCNFNLQHNNNNNNVVVVEESI